MTRRLGVGAAVTALLAAAVTAGAPAATAVDPLDGAPVVGQCFDMSPEELTAASYTEAAIDCASDHTAQVTRVALLPEGVAYETRAMTRFALETCFAAQRRTLGVKNMLAVNLSAYNVGFFGPTAEQQAAGARWIRCDIVLGSSAGLEPLPKKLELGRFPYRKSVSRCLAGRDFHTTVCTDRHTYRATAAIEVAGRKFPSAKAWKRLGNTRCVRGVTSRQFRFGWPSKDSWKAGDHTLTCYSRTRR